MSRLNPDTSRGTNHDTEPFTAPHRLFRGRRVRRPGHLAETRVIDAVKLYRLGGVDVRALDHVSVGFEVGRFTAVMGPSGSGKSTLMHCVAGLDALDSGRVVIGGTDLGELNDRRSPSCVATASGSSSSPSTSSRR